MMASVIVSDLGGVIYSFSKTFDSNEHNAIFNENLVWYSQHVDGFQQVVTEEANGNIGMALEVERIAVAKWFETPTAAGCLPVYFVIEALLALSKNALNYKVVIVSTSLEDTSRLILMKGFEAVGIDGKTVDAFDVHNMAKYGSKKDPLAWGKILDTYESIIGVVEDSSTNLSAAYEAAKKISPKVRKSLQMIVF